MNKKDDVSFVNAILVDNKSADKSAAAVIGAAQSQPLIRVSPTRPVVNRNTKIEF
jgi:hypothetical protein